MKKNARTETDEDKIIRFRAALDQFLQRLAEDRYVLAAVLVGSLSEATIWKRQSIHLWIIEGDGVSRRLISDGNDERVHRILVENEINIHAELIPRSRFKRMVEGQSRTAFTCSFFAQRSLVYCKDESIKQWFEQANTVAVKDQERELLTFSIWTIYALRRAKLLFQKRADSELSAQQIIEAANSIAYTEIIRGGNICEDIVIYKALELNPDLFQIIYLDVLAKRRNKRALSVAIERIEAYLVQHHENHLSPLLNFLQREDRLVPLSELSDHFAFSQVYPWHLESACEWLAQRGYLQKLSAPFKLTSRGQDGVEEPAYSFDR